MTGEQQKLAKIAREIYGKYGCDGKYILDDDRLIICQSNAPTEELRADYPKAEVNPLGDWTGGTDVDTGATNRKLDVSVNIWAWLKAQEMDMPVEVCCAIGDEAIGSVSFEEMVETARLYINQIGGFEKFAEWGLVR